ncbi:MAG TPA: glycosyl hydrolase [Galbitalea sp.]|jgi:endoglucanase Acf2
MTSRRNPITRLATIVASGLVLAVLAGCASSVGSPGTASSLDSAVGAIPHRSISRMPTARLASGLVPPTNRWFSGLVFGKNPQPVFPLPLSFGLTPSGFAFGQPKVSTSANTISGEFAPSIAVDDRSTSSVVTAYDQASVTISQRDASGTVGHVVIAEGSPTVSFTAARSTRLAVPGFSPTGSKGVYSRSVAGVSYGLVTPGAVAGDTLSLDSGQTAVWFVAPAGVAVETIASRVAPVTGVGVSYSVEADAATTSLDYHSAGSGLVVAMPHQRAGLSAPASCSLGTYPSVYGGLALCAGSRLAWSVPRVTPSSTLAGSLSSADKQLLTTQLAKDVAASPTPPTDSYGAGKAMYRLANLLELAHRLGDTASAATAQRQLDALLTKWTSPRGCALRTSECFVYDPAARGVVGLVASFGSDQFNDHHFHYGYFLYAASLAVKYDPALRDKIEPVMDLLAADIGTSSDSSSDFPQRRVFDPYVGHSWASGYAPFADGNNQESSSEAVNAWNGLALWGQTIGDSSLTSEAEWMLSAEAASARAYWTNFDASAPVYQGFAHGVVGINWGGKRDFATWFSAAPAAELGIQLIPMSPASTYLGGDAARIARNVASATPGGYRVQFGDYLLMYSALEGPSAATSALAAARSLPDADIDQADSRAYLYAWILSR